MAENIAQNFNEIRRERMKERLGMNLKPDEKTPTVENNSTEGENILDNEVKNPYIVNKSNEPTPPTGGNPSPSKEEPGATDDEAKLKELFEKQFQGDPLKAIKSWQHNQSEYMKLRNQSKEAMDTIAAFQQLVAEVPALADLINKAEAKELDNETLQSLINGGKEPTGKPDPSINESKPRRLDDTGKKLPESKLIEEGYLDESQKEVFSDAEWNLAIRQARLDYQLDREPELLAKRAAEEFQKQIAEAREQEKAQKEAEQVKSLNQTRYNAGVQSVISEFGLDFAGNEEHRKLLDEITQQAGFIVDPSNPKVISEDAVYLATVAVLRKHGVTPTADTAVDDAEQNAKQEIANVLGKNVFNTNRKVKTPEEPKTRADKLRARRIELYQKDIARRKAEGII